MTLHSLYIFDKYGDNIFYKQWNRSRAANEGEVGLVGGFISTLQHIASQLSSTKEGQFKAVQTPSYKLHYYETPTGYKAALLTSTDVATPLAQQVLARLFSEVFLAFVAENPAYENAKGGFITDTTFEDALEQFLSQHFGSS